MYAGASSWRCIWKVLLFSFRKCFRGSWATVLEILALEQKSFCETVAKSVLFWIFYLELWTKLLRQNRKSMFQWKEPSPPKSMLLAKFWKIWKIEPFAEFTWFSTFVSTSFAQVCRNQFHDIRILLLRIFWEIFLINLPGYSGKRMLCECKNRIKLKMK